MTIDGGPIEWREGVAIKYCKTMLKNDFDAKGHGESLEWIKCASLLCYEHESPWDNLQRVGPYIYSHNYTIFKLITCLKGIVSILNFRALMNYENRAHERLGVGTK